MLQSEIKSTTGRSSFSATIFNEPEEEDDDSNDDVTGFGHSVPDDPFAFSPLESPSMPTENIMAGAMQNFLDELIANDANKPSISFVNTDSSNQEQYIATFGSERLLRQ